MRRTPSFVGLAEEVGEVGEVRLLVLLVGLVGLVRQDWAAETCPNSQIASQSRFFKTLLTRYRASRTACRRSRQPPFRLQKG